MSTFHLILVLVGGVLNIGSGIGAMVRLPVILPLMDGAGVPRSWLAFPIGTLKVLGGAGLLVGLALPPVGIAAAAGLVLYWTCAVHTHLLANFWPKETVLTFVFLGLAIGTLALDLAL
jgi:uncharacterized membrane protein YphA (DoxX/SURF4 family)